MHELTIEVNENVILHYHMNSNKAEVIVSTEHDRFTLDANVVTFKGLFNILAYCSPQIAYIFNGDGVILYASRIRINDQLSLSLHTCSDESIEYNLFQVNLIHQKQTDEREVIDFFNLEEETILLFDAIDDFYSN